ncbi:hypothetical protein JNUCC83_04670 [Vagococcus sp. JNUCC 83]
MSRTKRTNQGKKRSSNQKATRQQENANTYLSKNPVWRFKRIDHAHDKWSLKNCCNFNQDILDKLISFEGMTWSQINQQTYGKDNKSSNHFIEVEQLDKVAKERLSELKIFDDEIYSLRLQGEVRLFGLLTNGVYHILWYDSKHEVCKSNKKHT